MIEETTELRLKDVKILIVDAVIPDQGIGHREDLTRVGWIGQYFLIAGQRSIEACFAVDGAPLFDGNPPGWTVYAPGSQHVPTVSGGLMLILYLLPLGAIEFVKA